MIESTLIAFVVLLSFGTFGEIVDVDVDIEGNIYVIDAERDLLVKYSRAGDSLMAVGGFGSGRLQFDGPSAVFAHRGMSVYVADRYNHRVLVYDRQLDFLFAIAGRSLPEEQGAFGEPLDLAVTRQGDLLVLDGENRRVVVFDASGRFLRSFGDIGDGAGRMTDPVELEVDDEDNVYLLDAGIIKIYDPFGAYLSAVPGINVGSMRLSADGMHLVVGDSSRVSSHDRSVDAGLPVTVALGGIIDRPLRVVSGRLYGVSGKSLVIAEPSEGWPNR